MAQGRTSPQAVALALAAGALPALLGGTAALQSDDDTVIEDLAVVELNIAPAPMYWGKTMVEAVVHRGRAARVDFLVDGEIVAEDDRAPFRSRVPLPPWPQPVVVEVRALDEGGEMLGRDRRFLNQVRDGFDLRFRWPLELPRETSGSFAVEVEVDLPHGQTAPPVELYWDGGLVASLERPARFDVGGVALYRGRLAGADLELAAADSGARVRRSSEGPDSVHWLRASARLDSGLQAESALVPGAGLSEIADVDSVEIPLIVEDADGEPVRDIRAEEIQVLEDGVEQTLLGLDAAGREPITVALALDVSNSMFEHIPRVQDAVRILLEVLGDDDRVLVVAFHDTPWLLQAPTRDAEAIAWSLEVLESRGGTAIYDALAFALTQLAGVDGRRAVVLLTDGDDHSSRLPPQRTARLVETTGVPVYLLRLPSDSRAARHPRTLLLDRVVEGSGGALRSLPDEQDLDETFAEIAQELRSQILLTYQSSIGGGEGWREIEIRVARPDVEVRTVSGYWAR